jgi:hypothetical protein
MQDRDGAKPVLLETYLRTGVRFVFADGAFAGRLLDWAQTLLRTTLHIVRSTCPGPTSSTRRERTPCRGQSNGDASIQAGTDTGTGTRPADRAALGAASSVSGTEAAEIEAQWSPKTTV